MHVNGWQFWIDRGGTFTDIVAKSPDGELIAHKLLSRSPNYDDAALQGILDVTRNHQQAGGPSLTTDEQPVPAPISAVRMGTTVATNALLEYKGERTLLAVTKGFKDQIRIGYQNRPQIFALDIQLPLMLYEDVIEIDERIMADGEIYRPLDEFAAFLALQEAYNRGFRSLAVVLMHSYRFPQHEDRLFELASQIGFEQISCSCGTVPLPKFVSRGDTTIADAYLSPILKRYINHLKERLEGTQLFFMQSSGGLADANHFRGKDSILSGPAGGIIGAVKTAAQLGEQRIITFDMGGTSTDVAHYAGDLERCDETQIAGSRIRAPMLAIHTVAAGGGSILHFEAGRFRVGPDSAGAQPGPAGYGCGGPLTITDCNVQLGRIQATHFPRVFGPQGNEPLNSKVVRADFEALCKAVNAEAATSMTPEEVAFGYLEIAIEKMANAIKQVSTQKGHDPADYTLYCFGGAGGQHACLIAEALGMRRVLIHKFAGVLSAYGMGLADVSVMEEVSADLPLTDESLAELEPVLLEAVEQAIIQVRRQQPAELLQEEPANLRLYADLRYAGTDFSMRLPYDFESDEQRASVLREIFSDMHLERYGFVSPDRELVIDKLVVEASMRGPGHALSDASRPVLTEGHQMERELALMLRRGRSVRVPRQRRHGRGSFSVGSTTGNPGATTPVNGEAPAASTEHSTTDMQHMVHAFFDGQMKQVPLYELASMKVNVDVAGPAIIVEPNSTIVCESNWRARKLVDGSLQLHTNTGSKQRSDKKSNVVEMGTAEDWNFGASKLIRSVLEDTENDRDEAHDEESSDETLDRANNADAPIDQAPHPVTLELFSNLFMFIAEQMGTTLQNTSYSVNIKERLDFSCALFDGAGNLIANAPHIPVHLGSMGESVQELIRQVGDSLRRGDVYALNDPYHGGTHLPDITVVTPFFAESSPGSIREVASKEAQGTELERPLFFVASRGHHADIGGITPGSMPPRSTSIDEEGVLLNMLKIVEGGRFLAREVSDALLTSTEHPARNITQNIADLQAQIAANQRGLMELQKVIDRYGLRQTQRYMSHVLDNAERYVQELLPALPDIGEHESVMDCGAKIKVLVSVDKQKRTVRIDFTGTSEQLMNNYNAPQSVCKAAVMYVFRTLVNAEIPLNAGCLRPLELVIPQRSLLSPEHPRAVVAGNVETSQVIVDTLYAALGVQAASQGTMNNFTFGNAEYQYYETIAGGAGATATAPGASAVQTHMTNSRMTDPEILELRFPVMVEEFVIRKGSGGAGKHNGGDGIRRKIRFLQAMDASILSNRRSTVPFGIKGGRAGLPGVNLLERATGNTDEQPQLSTLDYSATVSVSAGDAIVIETPGGGGFGPPD